MMWVRRSDGLGKAYFDAMLQWVLKGINWTSEKNFPIAPGSLMDRLRSHVLRQCIQIKAVWPKEVDMGATADTTDETCEYVDLFVKLGNWLASILSSNQEA
ncbi:hypothetical protein T265_08556 [Opisthorchis viverrini]|uniref:Uncharacterized protein n=1 Tax=Opisthorchis viverrini TaxID=6198 RepID=A0A074Z8V5_OPIVI|nr:hypothetical protein T265_08556 [Opisthorchis viverrini]KER23563.1 hypothetical protein T265_08556 [Opisthorchis viverrini]